MELIRIRKNKSDQLFIHNDVEIDITWNSEDGLSDIILKNKKTGHALKFSQGSYSEATVFIREKTKKLKGHEVVYELAGKEIKEWFDDYSEAQERRDALEESVNNVQIKDNITKTVDLF